MSDQVLLKAMQRILDGGPMNTSAEAAERIYDEKCRRYEKNYEPVIPDFADPEALRKLLEDDELATPIAWLMDAFEVAAEERDKVDPALGKTPAWGVMLKACEAIQRQLLEYAMRDPVMVRVEREYEPGAE